MSSENPTAEIVSNLLSSRLSQLQRATRLPVVFGGAVRTTTDDERLLLIEDQRGTMTSALLGLSLPEGVGLGGATLLLRAPKLVRAYADDDSISHPYDLHVVDLEQITSVFAFPVRLHSEVSAVFYGAVRDGGFIGDDALRAAHAVSRKMEDDLHTLLGRSRAPRLSSAVDLEERVSSVLAELGDLARTVDDESVRRRLAAVRETLGGAPAADGPRTGLLAPRETDALRLAATGATNEQIASQLGLSPLTVKSYLRNAMAKLDVHNRSAAVHAARTLGEL